MSALVLFMMAALTLPSSPSLSATRAAVHGNQPSELSAAQHRSRKIQRTKLNRPAPPIAPVYGWRPADPSFDQHGRPYRPPPGLPCPIDLGYGRWTSCLNDR